MSRLPATDHEEACARARKPRCCPESDAAVRPRDNGDLAFKADHDEPHQMLNRAFDERRPPAWERAVPLVRDRHVLKRSLKTARHEQASRQVRVAILAGRLGTIAGKV
jgi:hypothetical protein